MSVSCQQSGLVSLSAPLTVPAKENYDQQKGGATRTQAANLLPSLASLDPDTDGTISLEVIAGR